VFSVLRFTDSDYIPLWYLKFTNSDYIPLWYLRFTDSDYIPLWYLRFTDSDYIPLWYLRFTDSDYIPLWLSSQTSVIGTDYIYVNEKLCHNRGHNDPSRVEIFKKNYICKLYNCILPLL
jgi:hypothetical protein